MATDNDKKINILSLTDCLYFTNGFCVFKNKCHYRHCQAAIKQLQKCPNWPDSCRNIDCPYRHTGTPSKIPKPLPQEKGLVSFFWDIENVPIPKGQKPFDIVQRIRQKLVVEPGLQEADFSCYCNSNTIPQEKQQSLYEATVRIVHVPDRKLGAVDRQIMLDLDRFERTHRPPATIVLISGDIDFAGKLSDLRHQAGYHVIVIHNRPAKEELKAIVHAHYPWEFFTEPSQQQQLLQPVIRNNSDRLANQSANSKTVFNDRLNNDNNVNRITSSQSKQPPLTPLMDLHGENNLVHNNYLQSTALTSRRRSGSATRNHRSRDRAQPLKPPIIQSVNQRSASNVGSNSPPSPPTPIIASRARIRQGNSIHRLHQQNISTSGASEQISSTINDDTAKTQRNPVPCPYCTNEFSTIKALRQHQKDKNHLFDCPECKEGFPTKNSLKQHQIAKGHNISTDIDDQRNAQLNTADNLNMHPFATLPGNNLNKPNNSKRPPMYQKPIANDSNIDRNINNVNCVSNDED